MRPDISNLVKQWHLICFVLIALIIALRFSASSEPRIPDPAERARQISESSITVDGHNDIPHWVHKYGFDLGSSISDSRTINAEWIWVFGERFASPSAETLRTHTDLDRMKKGALNAQFFSVFVHPFVGIAPETMRDEALSIIDKMNQQFEKYKERIVLACTPEDVRSAVSNGLLAGMYGLEGGHAISDIKDVKTYLDAGVSYVTVTWAVSNQWAGSSSDHGRSKGLSDAGRKLVKELNDAGIIIDVSHISDPAFWDVISESRAPVIASHSSVRALVDTERNLTDDMLRALAENNGVVMINFGGIAIDPRKRSNVALAFDAARHLRFSDPSIMQVADHIEYAVNLIGSEHVGIGSDFDGTLFLPAGLKDVSGYPRLVQELIDRGFTDQDIKKILGENSLRVMSEVQGLASQTIDSCLNSVKT